MTVDLVQGVVVPEEKQQVVGVREYVQRHDHSEEHGHPGALQARSRQEVKDHVLYTYTCGA